MLREERKGRARSGSARYRAAISDFYFGLSSRFVIFEGENLLISSTGAPLRSLRSLIEQN